MRARHNDHKNLAQLRGLNTENAHVQPGARAEGGIRDHQGDDEYHERHGEHPARMRDQHTIIQRRHKQVQRQSDTGKQELPKNQVVCPVAACIRRGQLIGTVDHQQTDGDHDEHQGEQNPIKAARYLHAAFTR